MENKLRKLFDYQLFEQSEKLGELIGRTEARYARQLSDDDLFMVSAAGEVDPAAFGAEEDEKKRKKP